MNDDATSKPNKDSAAASIPNAGSTAATGPKQEVAPLPNGEALPAPADTSSASSSKQGQEGNAEAGSNKNLPLISFGVTVLFTFATIIAIILEKGVTSDDVFDFLSYGFPAIAAMAAGLVVFIRNEKPWFWVSTMLVQGGLFCYIVKIGELRSGWYQFVYFNGLIAIFVVLVIVSKLQDGRWKDKRWPSVVFGYAAIILFPLQCVAIMSIEARQTPPPSVEQSLKDMRCQKISGDIANGLVLRCTKNR